MQWTLRGVALLAVAALTGAAQNVLAYAWVTGKDIIPLGGREDEALGFQIVAVVGLVMAAAMTVGCAKETAGTPVTLRSGLLLILVAIAFPFLVAGLVLLFDNVPAEGLVFCPMATRLAAGHFVSLWHSRAGR